MAAPPDKDSRNNITYLLIAVVILAIIIITTLTITAIVAGPPKVL